MSKPTLSNPLVARQAQEYLEQNIQAWMKPTTQSFLSPALVNAALGAAPDPPPKALLTHSLSFGGCSHHSLLQETSFSSPCCSGGLAPGPSAPPSAAASFFARAAQRLNLSSHRKRRRHAEPTLGFRTNFADIIWASPPPAPPSLLRPREGQTNVLPGKVKVMVRLSGPASPHVSVDSRRRQLTLHGGTAAPKMFAFDAILSSEDSQTEVCSAALPDVLQAVVCGGTDGCVFAYGPPNLGKTWTMVGSSDHLGVIPTAVSWTFRLIEELRQRSGARFSVRVSAAELAPGGELRDLMAEHASSSGTEGSGSGGPSPGLFLRDDPLGGSQLLKSLSELRAPTAEKACFLLDAALAQRTLGPEEDARNCHFLFTLHVYQYRVEKGCKGGVAGGRSRLHMFDLGSGGGRSHRDGSLSLSALGNVILGLFNGQKHLPFKENKLTQLLREAMGSLTCRATMIAHVSALPGEALQTVQLASRVHRMRRKRLKFPTAAEDVCRPFVRSQALGEESGPRSGSDYTSSSEQSCDTVIFLGDPAAFPSPAKSTKTEHPSAAPQQPAEAPPPPKSESTASLKASVQSPRRTPKHRGSPCKTAPAQSDETWIDGPRFAKPKFDMRTLQQLEQEQWVDGPGVYGYMDHHKLNMIERWVEEHSNHVKDTLTRRRLKNEVWIDFPKTSGQDSSGAQNPEDKRSKPNEGCGDVDKASNEAEVSDDASDGEVTSADESQVPLLHSSNVELIEVEEPEEPVPTQDSCLQVTEEDILAECGSHDSHPLLALSEEDLDSTFTADSTDNLRTLDAATWRQLQSCLLRAQREADRPYSPGALSGDSSPRSTPCSLPARPCSSESSLDITSVQSEPPDLEAVKLGIKPMNGLKLEAFYNTIHKVPSFLSQNKPTQVVPPLITNNNNTPAAAAADDKMFLLSRLSLYGRLEGGDRAYKELPRNNALKSLFRRSKNSCDDDDSAIRSSRKSWLSSLRHPDGASNPHLHKHPSLSRLAARAARRSPGNGGPAEGEEDSASTQGRPEPSSGGSPPKTGSSKSTSKKSSHHGSSKTSSPKHAKIKSLPPVRSPTSSSGTLTATCCAVKPRGYKGCSGRRLPPSPYHKVTRPTQPATSSSGHGSDVSPGNQLTATQQLSGTSSGYESMMRDSEDTPLSSAESANGEDARRQGRRRGQGSNPGSPVHHQPGPSCPPPRRGPTPRKTEEDVGCTGLLCCRMLDFYS